MGITLNVPKAAAMMKVHPETVKGMIDSGELPAAKIGRAWVLLEKDVVGYIESKIMEQTAQHMGTPIFPIERCAAANHYHSFAAIRLSRSLR